MYTYLLRNEIPIKSERLVEAVLSATEWPQVYLDCETGIIIEVPSPESLGHWVAEIGKSQRYVNLERFSDEERNEIARQFIDLILAGELPAKQLARTQETLKRDGWSALEDYLANETDGWIHAWDQYFGDEAWEYVHEWLTENPRILITTEFAGDCNCAICQTIKNGKNGDLDELLKAFQTEAVMQLVEHQITQQSKPITYALSKAAVANTDQAFVFKISLNNSKPKIWRRLILPAQGTFFELHCAIQDSMGWEDYHLHNFTIDTRVKGLDKNKSSFEHIHTISFPDPENDGWDPDPERKDERMEILAEWFGVVMKQCVYTYDFGDNWDHTVLLEKVIPLDLKVNYPQCTGGKNAGPPEDCGGVWGYQHLQKVLNNPKHEEHHDMLEWLGLETAAEFQPTQFYPAEVKFGDSKARLKEYEKQFGVKSLLKK